MLSRLVFSTATRAATRRAALSDIRVSKRLMSADAAAHHEPFKPKSDLPWIIGAVAVAGPSLAYLLKDTVAIKTKISEGHHGHGEHDEHAVLHKVR
ncbi:hypothetical protein B0H16DRAFT_1491931 [Mycena metata]|uniref:Uncharacterized protein n=1 Tax=Mycena metata TaxID=1033252 RepID=A0AAD7P1T2_9AGAR|nr:hypothetical protein B0H16DRAFT_1491931 [Mycena metata]